MRRLLLYASLVASAAVFGVFAARVEAVAAAALALAGVLFGLVSSLVAARRLYFLAGAAPHTALFAALGSVILSYWLGLGVSNVYALYGLSVVVGVLAVYIAGYMIHRGGDPDVATSILVGFASSMSVIEAYYIKTSVPVGFDVLSIVFGDPLLVTWRSVAVAALVAAAAGAVVALGYRIQVYIGVDRDSVRLSGARLWAYDLAFFTVLGAVVVALIKVVGFVLEHILLLLPGAAAATAASSAEEALAVSLAVSVSATALGLLASMFIPVAPAGAVGAAMLALYAALSRARRG